jgi:hypothetical protein
MKANALIGPEHVAVVGDLKRRIAAARLHAANLEQPVQDLCSNVRSTAALVEGAEFPPTVEERP